MNKEVRKMIKEINDGKNLEVVLPQYSTMTAEVLNEYAVLQLALEYYGLKEYIEDEISENKDTYEETKGVIAKLNELMEQVIINKTSAVNRNEQILSIDSLRNQVMEKMDVLTMYTDKLRVYEYVLNRFELDYADQYEEISDDVFLEQLQSYLFGTQDNVVINARIQEMVGQLPVRMLKTKFFDYVKASFDRYKDSDEESLETYEYMLKTNATLYRAENAECHFNGLKAVCDELGTADYSDLAKEKYQKLCGLLLDSSVYINQLSDIYLFIQKVINNLYIYVLTMPYVLHKDEVQELACTKIITILNENFENALNEDINNELMELLDQIVGKQEVCYERYIACESALSDVKMNHMQLVEAIEARPVFECLFLCEKLCSNSVFIDIHKEEKTVKVTEEKLNTVTESFILELTNVFKGYPQCINRAIMANILSTLPVFFGTSNEVMEYAKSSLEQCKNVREKTVAMRLLLDEMVD